MTRTEKTFWRAFFLIAACVLMPFTMALGIAGVLIVSINMRLLRLIRKVFAKFDSYK